jgi:UDP-N-acetylmuramoylalanine--D-glutamate ligase
MKLAGKHVLVLGLGESGPGLALWCARQGARVRVADTRAAPPYLEELRRRVASADFSPGEFDQALLEGIDLLVLSPGLPGDLPGGDAGACRRHAGGGRDRVVRPGAVRRTGPVAPVLAITGTNGKTTTTALTGHLLRAAGRRVGVAGNISPAALAALMDAEDAQALPQVWVLELSSFQLETTTTLCPAAATVLNISDDHLDRYAGVDDYAAAKARIFSGDGGPGAQSRGRAGTRHGAGGTARHQLRPRCAGRRRGFRHPPESRRALAGAGRAPAAAACRTAAGRPAQCRECDGGAGPVRGARLRCRALLPALRSFRGLPHRVEKIAEIDGVTWYDDSKGTNVGATVAALNGLGGMNDRKCVVILGGDGKAQDFSPLRDAVARHARAAILIGRDGPLIGKAIAAAACRSKPPPTWTMPCAAPPRWRSRATRRCCRRPAPASTCSAITSIAPRCSPPRCAALGAADGEPRLSRCRRSGCSGVPPNSTACCCGRRSACCCSGW